MSVTCCLVSSRTFCVSGSRCVKAALKYQICLRRFVFFTHREWGRLSKLHTDLTAVHTCAHTHTQRHDQSYRCFLCCPGNAASSRLVDICGSVMGTRLPGERGCGGGRELNLPAPLAQFPSLSARASGGEEWVLQRRSASCQPML